MPGIVEGPRLARMPDIMTTITAGTTCPMMFAAPRSWSRLTLLPRDSLVVKVPERPEGLRAIEQVVSRASARSRALRP